MNRKTIGYILSVLGIIVFILTFDTVKAAINLPVLGTITNSILTIIAIVLVVIGILLLYKTSSKEKEVPIFKDKEVVGYRRIKSK
jgi:uncharacterized membrane protein